MCASGWRRSVDSRLLFCFVVILLFCFVLFFILFKRKNFFFIIVVHSQVFFFFFAMENFAPDFIDRGFFLYFYSLHHHCQKKNEFHTQFLVAYLNIKSRVFVCLLLHPFPSQKKTTTHF